MFSLLCRSRAGYTCTSSQHFSSLASLHCIHQPFYTFFNPHPAIKFHRFVFRIFEHSVNLRAVKKNMKNWNHAATSLIHLFTRHMLTQLQTCKPFHLTFSDQDIGQVLQLIQLQQDPAMQMISN